MGQANSKKAGREMASRMFAEIQRVHAKEPGAISTPNRYAIFAKWRYRGEPQDNIVARYVGKATTAGSACLEGFCAALTDHLGRYGAEWPGVYARATDQEINRPLNAPTRGARQSRSEALH